MVMISGYMGAIAASGGTDDDPFNRDPFWAGEGYTRQWFASPLPSDVGETGDSWFLGPTWSNGQPIYHNGLDETAGDCQVVEAPDGTPSIKITVFEGHTFVFQRRGDQLGTAHTDDHVVCALEMYNPSPGGWETNGASGIYVGFGRLWGAVPEKNQAPGGSVYHDDAWSLRVPITISHNYFLYWYGPDTEANQGGVGGDSFAVNEAPKQNQWTLIEMEVVQSTPGVADGILRCYIDGVLEAEHTGIRTRLSGDSDNRPRGVEFFVRHNSGAPQQEVAYYRNWKLYTR